MKNVTVEKGELLAALQRNRAQHEEIFKEALVGYKEEAIRQLEDFLERVRAGSMKRVQVYLPAPENHMKDYDRVIAMVTMSVDPQIELDATSFAQYVLDDWGWKRQFLASNSGYSATATRMLGDDEDE